MTGSAWRNKTASLNLSLFVEDQNDPNIEQTPPFWLCMQ
jgi:hypothetical protein